jgi:purine-binding chemotaxis protein CheW
MVETITKDIKIIVFQLKEKEYAIPVEHVRSIEKEMHITRVPGVSPYINGVINLRGVVTPIVDLGKCLDLSDAENTENTRIIIAVIGDLEVGLIVDSANDVLDIPKDSIEPPPEIVGGTETEYINGVVKIDKRLLILLDLEKVLQDGQKSNVIEGK